MKQIIQTGRWILACILLVLIAPPGFSQTITTLEDGVTLSNLSGVANSSTLYQISIPAGTGDLQFATTGGIGNVDLYVGRGTQPSVSNHIAKSEMPDNVETVILRDARTSTNQPAVYYLLVHAKTNFSGLSLRAQHLPLGLNGGAVYFSQGSANAQRIMQIVVPQNPKYTTVEVHGVGSGKVYVQKGVWPTASNHLAKDESSSSSKTINIPGSAGPGTYYVMATGVAASPMMRAYFFYNETTIGNNAVFNNLSASRGESVVYKIDLPPGGPTVNVRTYGGTGQLELLTRSSAPPIYGPASNNSIYTSTNTAHSYSWPNFQESHRSSNFQLYIMLSAPYGEGYSGVNLEVNYEGKKLVPGVPTTALSSTPHFKLYEINVPVGATDLNIKTLNGTGNVDIYTQYGKAPVVAYNSATTAFTVSDYLSHSAGSSTTENISIPVATPGKYFILMAVPNPNTSYQNVNLVASYSMPPINGVPKANLSGAAGSQALYKFAVPSGITISNVSFNTIGGSGNANLYVQYGTPPTTSSYLAKSDAAGNTESISLTGSDAKPGIYYVLVNGATAYSGVSLTSKWATSTFKTGIHAHRLYNGNGETWDDWIVVDANGNIVRTDNGNGDILVTDTPDSNDILNADKRPSTQPQFQYALIRDWDIETMQDFRLWQQDLNDPKGWTINKSLIDQVYSGHAANGAKVIKTFATVPGWMAKRPNECDKNYGHTGSMSGPADLKQYKAYVKEFVSHVHAQGWLWAVEGWNEPYPTNYNAPSAYGGNPCTAAYGMVEFTTMSPTELADAQKAVWEATKEVDPTLLVLSPAQAYLGGMDDLLNAKTSQGEPITQFFDVLAWHAYNRRDNTVVPFESDRQTGGGEPDFCNMSGSKELYAQRVETNTFSEVRCVRQQIQLARNAGTPIAPDIPLIDTEHGWLGINEGNVNGASKEGARTFHGVLAAPWRNPPRAADPAYPGLTDQQKADMLYDTAQLAKDKGLLGVIWYGYDNYNIGKPMNSSIISNTMQQMYDQLNTP